ncbi:MAG: type III secretion protein [Deltaproteobacteria bacterium]|nr:MAG: type III secretion protein [Deltaproteobacteria bacterium]
MELYALIQSYTEKFIPVFVRTSVILFLIPYLGSRVVPLVARAGLALALTLFSLPLVPAPRGDLLLVTAESLFVGAAMGLIVRILIGAVETAAHWIGLEVGLGIASVFNPQFGEALSPLSLFYSLSGMALFFILNVHVFFVEAIVRSFSISSLHFRNIFDGVVGFSTLLFPLALKIAVPVMLVQVLVNVSLGFFAKVMPQANVFFVGFPLLIFVGIVFVILSFPLVTSVVTGSFINVKDLIGGFMR